MVNKTIAQDLQEMASLSAESDSLPPPSIIAFASLTSWLHLACSSSVALHFSMLDFNVSRRDKSSTPATLRWSNEFSCTDKLFISASIARSCSSVRVISERMRGIVDIDSTIAVSNWSV
jgi:hypothetical protein